MNIFAAIKREEKKLEKQLRNVQGQLTGLRTAAKALGHSADREVLAVQRWAKVRRQAKKAVA
jgi:hypothetical protein